MSTVAFIESNTTGTGHILAKKALARGHRVAFLTANPSRHPWLIEELIHPVLVDTQDQEAMLTLLRDIPDLAAVLSSSEYYLEPSAHIAKALGLPGPSAAAVALCRDKWRLSQRLDDVGCPSPNTSRVTSLEEAEQAWERHGAPVIVKPVAGSGSIGVRSHSGPESFFEHVNALLKQATNERGQPVQPVVLVQNLVGGPEFSVEMFSTKEGHKLIGITQKHLGEPPNCLEIAHDFPAEISEEQAQRIEDGVKAALKAVGWTLGPTHAELKLDGDVPVIIEINPRLAGGMIPVLIENALGIDVLEALLDLYLSDVPNLEASKGGAASIAFVLPPRAGRITQYDPPGISPDWLVESFRKKRVGDDAVREGDFRDRLGHVIASGSTPSESRARAQVALKAVTLRLDSSGDEGDTPAPRADTGRLKRTLHPEAMSIIRKVPPPATRKGELGWLTAIDEAHLIMLVESNILKVEQVRPVLREIRRLRDDDFEELIDSVAPRGTYLLYEDCLIGNIGVEAAGITHTGRSRNDINASLFRLKLRERYESVYRGLWRLRSALLAKAAQHLDVAMPVYSQFQPGLPGTFAYYLQSVEEALSRDQIALQVLLSNINTSTLGACAGGGTPFPITPKRSAALLGFTAVAPSALDAVASRDLGLRLLSAISTSGMSISRFTQDLQLWTTLEFGFITLPDELSGGSSMMPQKKNPYLLEMIKGRLSRLPGYWAAAIAAMSKAPFSNSVESGTEAVRDLNMAMDTFEQATALLSLIVDGAKANPAPMARSVRDGIVCASLVTDTLVQDTGIAFRSAHHLVGAAIRTALDKGQPPEQALGELLTEGSLGTDPLTWAHRYEYGGGPGKTTTQDALHRAGERLDNDARWWDSVDSAWRDAAQLRQGEVDGLLSDPQESLK